MDDAPKSIEIIYSDILINVLSLMPYIVHGMKGFFFNLSELNILKIDIKFCNYFYNILKII